MPTPKISLRWLSPRLVREICASACSRWLALTPTKLEFLLITVLLMKLSKTTVNIFSNEASKIKLTTLQKSKFSLKSKPNFRKTATFQPWSRTVLLALSPRWKRRWFRPNNCARLPAKTFASKMLFIKTSKVCELKGTASRLSSRFIRKSSRRSLATTANLLPPQKSAAILDFIWRNLLKLSPKLKKAENQNR